MRTDGNNRGAHNIIKRPIVYCLIVLLTGACMQAKGPKNEVVVDNFYNKALNLQYISNSKM